jgi:hypothetical protein
MVSNTMSSAVAMHGQHRDTQQTIAPTWTAEAMLGESQHPKLATSVEMGKEVVGRVCARALVYGRERGGNVARWKQINQIHFRARRADFVKFKTSLSANKYETQHSATITINCHLCSKPHRKEPQ